jgi:hypothetical protein
MSTYPGIRGAITLFLSQKKKDYLPPLVQDQELLHVQAPWKIFFLE